MLNMSEYVGSMKHWVSLGLHTFACFVFSPRVSPQLVVRITYIFVACVLFPRNSLKQVVRIAHVFAFFFLYVARRSKWYALRMHLHDFASFP